MLNILLASSPGYWFRQKTLYSDFELFLSRFCTLQIFYTVAFVIIGAICANSWYQEHKKRKSGGWFQLKVNRENTYLALFVCVLLFILGTWLGR